MVDALWKVRVRQILARHTKQLRAVEAELRWHEAELTRARMDLVSLDARVRELERSGE